MYRRASNMAHAVFVETHFPNGGVCLAGQYQIPGAVGRQVTSTKRSAPLVGFGSGTREATKKVFISIDHEKRCEQSTSNAASFHLLFVEGPPPASRAAGLTMQDANT
jgi:hypothetical protein